MGVVPTIKWNKFPRQNEFLNKKVTVCFHYDSKHTIDGTIVRNDLDYPYVTIIKLDDDRLVLATECMYSLKD